ncbi:AcvB/VirJ family lysyl-phosphatidylglycerol hydrolase [Sphingobacterium bambusae]|uniref:AcvB/VirJ family lysyl-phosphatidylglycerol hydrolase n=1 Tax=Sphingobacterium bambusae TaxID=662858 RepID=A0ABW6B9A8_9SPHI|nr:AcvB/VirJ family lysyl-phosphatidylglycerol hydrolase [Sphingobacterium bambusae]WPL48378.1 AcvB/VirJ family lysyl-phosphatidylglycerol hydrolase [Sphingobacterium bambusae]
MARYLAEQGALVAGIDAKAYKAALAKQKKGCLYPAADFEQLSLMLQKKYKFKDYQKPILVGYSYGATLVYGLLAQAPSGTFMGAIALGFSPDIELPAAPCKANGLPFHRLKQKNTYYLDPVKAVPSPFLVLNGLKDEVCDYEKTELFLKDMQQAELIGLPLVGHGFSITDNWLPQFKSAYQKIRQTHLENSLGSKHFISIQTDLPIHILAAKENKGDQLLFFLSGDGGWTSFDQGLAAAYTKQGFTVMGLDAQKYFWQKRSPEETTAAISHVLQLYLKEHPNARIALMGYSFGACIAPFVANRLIGKPKENLKEIILLSPDTHGDFEIHVSDMLSFGLRQNPYDVVAELRKTSGIQRLCLFGDGEDSAVTQAFKRIGVAVEILPGGHHYNNDFNSIVDATSKTR